MEEQDSKSNWEELARELGAEITNEVKLREEAVLAQPKSAPKPEPPIERAPPPKKAAADWNELAGELGLPPLPPEEKPVVPAEPPKQQRAAAREELRREPPRRETPRHDEEAEPPRREQSRRDESRGDDLRRSQGRRQDRPPRSRDEQVDREQQGERPARGERGSRGGRGEERGRGEGRGRSEGRRDERGRRDQQEPRERHERPRPPREFDADSEADREVRPATDDVREIRAETRAEPPAPVREEPPKPAAVSLWHKIFGSPAEQTAKISDEPEALEVSRQLEDRDEPRDAGGFADAHADENTQDDREGEFARREDRPSGGEEGESSDLERGRPRRRRGRGRGRGGRSESRSDEGRPDESRQSERPRRPARAEREDQIDDDELDDDLSDDLASDLGDDADDGAEGEEVGAGAPRGRSVLQRAIPSWDEAIGFIVDSNMQTRSQRRPPSRGGSRENGGRGRGRGRRKQ